MKKVVFGSLVLVSSVFGQCFDAVDFTATSVDYIGTKKAAQNFLLKITKDSSCATKDIRNVVYKIVNTSTKNEVDSTISSTTYTSPGGEIIDVKIPNSHKDLLVKISYNVITTNVEKTEVTCPAEPWTKTTETSNGVYAVYNGSGLPNESSSYTCYEVKTTTNTDPYVEYSTDNFSVIPYELKIQTSKNKAFSGQVIPTKIIALNKDGDVTTNYTASSTDLKVSFVAGQRGQYAFDIIDGKDLTGKVVFNVALDNSNFTVKDTTYSAVDADDNKKDLEGTSNDIDIKEISKYWAGTGINDEDNNDHPLNSTVQTKVKQNVQKDLHFKKMSW